MTYTLIYAFLAVLCIVNPAVKKEQKYWLMYGGAIIILLFQALRWKTGTDWNAYLNEFLNVNNSSWIDDFEPGYQFLNSIVRYITDKYTAFLFLECGLNLLFITYFLRKMPINNPCLGLLYFFVLAIFPIRFTLASNMVVCSYIFILEKKPIPFCLLILGAYLIHRTAIAFLPVYLICQRNYSFKFLMIIYISAIILGLLAEYTFGNLLQMASVMYGFADTSVQGKMDAYITGEIPDRLKMTPIRYALSIINSTIFILIFYYFKRKNFNQSNIYSLLFTLYVFGISFNRIFLQTIPDMARMTSFFTGGFIIMTIMIISSLKKSIQPIATIGVIGYLFITYRSQVYGYYQDLFIPYYTVFENPIRSMY